MKRLALCVAVLLFGSVSWADRIDPVSVHAERDIHSGLFTVSVELSRAPDLFNDVVSIHGYSSEELPHEVFALNNGWPVSDEWRIRSEYLYERRDTNGSLELIRNIRLGWTPVDAVVDRREISFSFPFSDLQWTSQNMMIYVESREASTPGPAERLMGQFTVNAPEPSGLCLAGVAACILLARWRPRTNRRPGLRGIWHVGR